MKKKLVITVLMISSIMSVQADFWGGVKNFFKETGTFIKNTVKGAGKVVAAPFRSSDEKEQEVDHENEQIQHGTCCKNGTCKKVEKE